MADIITTMTSAIALTTRLRDISKNLEEAEFKNILADLNLELALLIKCSSLINSLNLLIFRQTKGVDLI
ncbi:hypothetical protein O4H27_20010 [Pseudoalteromonas shioyasakiensis]|nr:hypothetical protein [Pseudoalteromonas shioyasakiensis]